MEGGTRFHSHRPCQPKKYRYNHRINTRLTVALARATSEQFASSPANFVKELNLVCETLMTAAMWNDLLGIFDFKNGTGNGLITLPDQCASVVGWQLYNQPRGVFDMWREWQEGGYGHLDPEKCRTSDIYELPAGAVVQNDISNYGQYGNLLLAINNPGDAGKICRFGGLDQNGEPIYDSMPALGVNLTSTYPNAQTGQLFSVLQTVQLPGFVGSCNLYVVINGVPSLLAYYNPGTTLPYWRRYSVGIWPQIPNSTPVNGVVPIRCFCRLQHVDFVAETDFVRPGSRNAIETGLQALKERRAQQFTAEDMLWKRAFAQLDNDLQQYRGAAQTTLRLEGMALPRADSWGGWGYGYGWGVN